MWRYDNKEKFIAVVIINYTFKFSLILFQCKNRLIFL